MAAVSATGRAVCRAIFGDFDSIRVERMSILADHTLFGLFELCQQGFATRKPAEEGGMRFTLTKEGRFLRHEVWDSAMKAVGRTPFLLQEPKPWMLLGRAHECDEWARSMGLAKDEWVHVDGPDRLRGVDTTTARARIVGMFDDETYRMARSRGFDI